MIKPLPFKAWYVDRACKPKLIEVVRHAGITPCYETENGQIVNSKDLYETRLEAMDKAREYLGKLDAQIQKLQALHIKRLKAFIKMSEE